MPPVSPFMSHLAPPSAPKTDTSRRPRSSVDVDRPQVDASILGIPQGWDDDPDVDVNDHDPPHPSDSRIASRPMLPLRSRIHLTSRANRQRTLTQISTGRHDTTHAAPGVRSVSRDIGTSQSRPIAAPSVSRIDAFKDDRHPGMFETSRKRHCGEGIYRVGYEREVLDT